MCSKIFILILISISNLERSTTTKEKQKKNWWIKKLSQINKSEIGNHIIRIYWKYLNNFR